MKESSDDEFEIQYVDTNSSPTQTSNLPVGYKSFHDPVGNIFEQDGDNEDDYSANIHAEELQKAKNLEVMRHAVRDRINPHGNRNLSPIPTDLILPISRANSFRERKQSIIIPDGQENTEEHDVEVADLFESIPEPYPHSQDFRRLIITETNEPVGEEVKQSCNILKKCLFLREVRI